jgi:Spy/CpxP family protein refolding chaperone
MKRHVFVALVALSVTPGTAAAQLMGGMMSGGGAPPPMAGGMMSSLADGMMPGPVRGCMMMAEGVMRGWIDLDREREELALSDDQTEKLRAGLRPLQKDAILTLASLKVAELELADILAGAKVDFGRVEAKLKEIEAMRTRVRLVHLRACEAVKGVLSKEQLERLRGRDVDEPAPAQTPPQQGVAP